MTEKRRNSRVIDSLEAEINAGGKNYSGIVLNFSEAGLYMVTATARIIVDITPSTLLELKCKLPTGKNTCLKCEVKWFQTKKSPHGISFSMGMQILNPPKEYKEFLKTVQ